MAICTSCGAEFQGRFCPQCGTPANGGSEPSGPEINQTPPPSGAPPQASGSAMTENVAATLCYVLGFITGIVFLILEPYNRNPNVRFHAFQSIFLSVALIVIQIGISVLLPWTLSIMLGPLVSLAAFVLWIFLLIKTYQNQKVVLPFVGPLAEKQA